MIKSLGKPGLVLALTRGRVLAEQLQLLAQVGIAPTEDPQTSRKLVLPTSRADLSLMVLRGMDVATYVQHGIADLGITGKDVLLEHGGDGYYEPLDLGLGRCRLMEAGFPDDSLDDWAPQRMKVATKFLKTAKRYYAMQGRQVDVIHLYGGMELAPLSGLADRIVDLVDTGNTLKANGLVPLSLIMEISTRLIVNKVSRKTRSAEVTGLMEAIKQVVS